MHHFFVDKNNIENTGIIITNKDDIHHLSNVLRVKQGEKLSISDGENIHITKITSINKNEIVTKIISTKCGSIKNIKVNIFQCVPKKKKFESIISNTTALGANSLTPVISLNCEVHKNVELAKLKERWTKILLEASHQSKRLNPLIINDITKIDEMKKILEEVKNNNKDSLIISTFLNENEKEVFLKNVLENDEIKSALKSSQKIIINTLIGPEGGFDKSEEEFLKTFCHSVSLGENILRTELASVVFLGMLKYTFTL